MMNVFFIEFFCTTIFVLINLLVKTGKTVPSAQGAICCLIVAITLMAMIKNAGYTTGAAINPAVALSLSTF